MPKTANTEHGTVLQLVDDAATASLLAPAIQGSTRSISYSEATERRDRLTEVLRGSNVMKGGVVAICIERSIELVIGVLGILKAGAAYVPIDPAYPLERIALMLEDARPTVIITDRQNRHLFNGNKAQVICLEDLDLEQGTGFTGACPAGPNDLCYILFTSGSTGRPKGVVMHHAPLLNLIEWQVRTSVPGPGAMPAQLLRS